MGAKQPSPTKVLEVLKVIGLSAALLVTILAALADPEPASKLGLAGLTAAEATMLLVMLGYKKQDGSAASSGGPTASAAMPTSSGATSTTGNSPGNTPA